MEKRISSLFAPHGALWGPIAALFFLVLLLVLPSLVQAGSLGLRVGVLEEPKSLNPWLASDAWSNRVLSLIYQPLYIREPKELKMVPWLAASLPEYDKGSNSYTVELREAKWSDGTPVTAHDVAFTGQIIKTFKIPRFSSRWKVVDKIEVLSDKKVRFVLKKPKANFLTATLVAPIVQKKQWGPILLKAQGAQKPLTTLLRYKLDNPVGTGPFQLARWESGVFVHMVRNPHFFGKGLSIAGLMLDPKVKAITFKIFGTADAAVLGLRKGEIDFYWNSIQAGYLSDLAKDTKIQLFKNKKSALYYFGFNVRKAPFNDRAFRQAVAYLIDKDFIITRILQDNGESMRSLVPAGNSFYYNPGVPDWSAGTSREERVRRAYRVLKKAGYTWEKPPVDASGKVQKTTGIQGPDGKPLADFTILTPPADYDTARAMSGKMIQEWLRGAGIPGYARPMAFGALIQKVKGRRDFDCFVLGYGKLSLDPGYLRAFFHSTMDRPRGWNMSGYSDPEFDKMALAQDEAMNPQERKKIIFAMQQKLMTDLPYIPLYNPFLVEGVRKDRFQGWVSMLGGVGNLWSFCTLTPVK